MPRGAERLALFERALARLDEALATPEDAIVRDACIQRFEFTFEMAWKALQANALAEGLECVSPRDCFRVGFRLGLLEKNAPWMTMVEDRNGTAHDESTAAAIYRALPEHALLMRQLLERLRAAQLRQASEP